jgi:hypothetical protein
MTNSRNTIKHSTITLTCFGLLVVTIASYLYFLNMSVVQVVMRTETVQKQRELTAQIAVLESSYIDAQHEIASRLGTLTNYQSDSDKIFVARPSADSLVLGGN